MNKNESNFDANLIRTLSSLHEIGASINQLGTDSDLHTTLTLIATGAVKAVAAGSVAKPDGAKASAVIWVYDAVLNRFDAASRVSAGEPEGASFDDFPRPNGLGMQAIRQRRRVTSYETRFITIHPIKRDVGARSLVCYPLIAGSEIVGVLYVYRCDEHRFSEIELLILDNFVELAAMAINYGRKVVDLSQALSRKVRQMEKLKRASNLISSRTNLDETLKEILAIGLDMTAAQYGSFDLYDRRTNLLMVKALAGSFTRPSSELDLPADEQSIVGWVAVNRQSLCIDDLRHPRWRTVYHPLPIDLEMRSELAVPIIGASGGLEGIINVESPQPNAFTEDDQQLLEALATQAVIAIQEIRLLDAMQEIVDVQLTASDDDLLRLIIDRACDLMNVSSGSIWLVTEADTLVLRQSTEVDRLGEVISLSTSFTGQAIKLHQPIAVDDIRNYPRFMHPALALKKGWVSAIVVPLVVKGDNSPPVGSFCLYATYMHDFSDWDKKLLTCLADHAAVAIRDTERLRQLKQAQERQATAETIAAVGDVAANLLHQLNNKFGAISVRVQGIEDKCPDALASWPYLSNNLTAIADSTRQAMTIVRDSMAPLQPAATQPVEISICLERAVQRATPPRTVKIRQKNIKELLPVVAGEKQLEMVFYNLIDNALKAMEGSGVLTLIGQQRDNLVGVTVQDTGSGIPPEIQATIFEFDSAAHQLRRKESGRLSFGLWWVKTFVNRFGGRVDLVSEVDQGSSFTVWLPVEKVKKVE